VTDPAVAVLDRRDDGRLAALAASPVDPLLACLEYLTRHFDRPYSAEVLRAGLPVGDEKLRPALLVRAAERAGFTVKIAARALDAVPAHALPAILILDRGEACVLIARNADAARVFWPETGGVSDLPPAQFAPRYAGYAIYVRPVHRRDAGTAGAARAPRGHWLRSVLWGNAGIYGQAALGAVLINLFALAIPLFTMIVYDRVVPNNAIETLWVLALGAAIVLGFDLFVRILRGYYIDTAGKRADVTLASRLFDRVLDIELAARPRSAGALASTLRDFESLRDFLTSATLTAVIDLPFALFFIVVIALLGGPLALVPLLALPLVIGFALAAQVPLTRLVEEGFREGAAKNAILFEALGGLETIKSIGAEGRMRLKWETAVARNALVGVKARFWSQLALNAAAFVQQGAAVAILVLGAILVGLGSLTIGALIACVILNGRAIGALAQIASLGVRLNQARASYRALDAVMSLPTERSAERSFLHRPRLSGNIAFREVTFAYPGQSAPALKNVSFAIAAGERVGLIGRVGSGKSTVHKLVLGLYAPGAGAVLVDGTDLRQIDPVDLRRNIGCAPQDVVLFAGSVRENIALGAPGASDAAVRRAALAAGVEEFIAQHPQGYDFQLGERGDGLSGGQRQAIAIARALIDDPPILLLDEPTSSMDNAAETALRARLAALAHGKTLLLVTHRASLLPLVDRLIVLERGQVVADGPKQKVLDALAEGRVAMLGT